MVASAVLLIFLSLVYSLFVASKRYQDNCRTKIELQEQVLLALTTMSRELVESDRYAVQVDAPSQALSFSSPRGADGRVSFDSHGRLLWKKFVVFYVALGPKNDYCLFRKMGTLPAPVGDVPPPPAPLTLRDDASLPATVKARHIREFKPVSNSDGTYGLTVKGEYRSYEHKYGVEVTATVFPQN